MHSASLTIDGSALYAQELQTGDLLIEGLCVVWDSLDLEDEGFLRGALDEAIPEYLDGRAVLAWHHQPGTFPLGRVLDMKPTDAGVWFRARVDRQEPGSPMFDKYEAIRRGTARGVSIAGVFSRKFVEGVGPMIDRVVRLVEVSITPAPVDGQAQVFVAEVKALRAAVQNSGAITAGEVIQRLLILKRAGEQLEQRLIARDLAEAAPPVTIEDVRADASDMLKTLSAERVKTNAAIETRRRRREAAHGRQLDAWKRAAYVYD